MMEPVKAQSGRKVPHEEWLRLFEPASQLQQDADRLARDVRYKNDHAIVDHFVDRYNQISLAMFGLNLAVFLAWASKRAGIRRFMVQPFTQSLPPSRTAPHTLLFSAFGQAPKAAGGLAGPLTALGAFIIALPLAAIECMSTMGPFYFPAFYMSAAAVSSLGGMSFELHADMLMHVLIHDMNST